MTAVTIDIAQLTPDVVRIRNSGVVHHLHGERDVDALLLHTHGGGHVDLEVLLSHTLEHLHAGAVLVRVAPRAREYNSSHHLRKHVTLQLQLQLQLPYRVFPIESTST